MPSRSEIEIEVLSQVQRTRSLFPRATLDAERRHFVERKPALYAALNSATVDPKGREIARAYFDSFYKPIGNDADYYRPVVARSGVRIFLERRELKRPVTRMTSCTPGHP